MHVRRLDCVVEQYLSMSHDAINTDSGVLLSYTSNSVLAGTGSRRVSRPIAIIRLRDSVCTFSRSTDVTSTDLVSSKGKTKEVCCCDIVVLIVLF